MSRFRIWVLLSLVGFAYWGAVHRFAVSDTEYFAGPLWFGGIALALHWFTNRRPAAIAGAGSSTQERQQ